MSVLFQIKIQQTGFQRFILRNIIILLFYHVCFIEWNETVSFIIPENLFLIVCIPLLIFFKISSFAAIILWYIILSLLTKKRA